MIAYQVKVDTRKAQLALEAVEKALADPNDFLPVLGRAVANSFKDHWRKLDAKQPNKLGGKRTHFWSKVADSVQSPKVRSVDKVVVSVGHSVIAHKLGVGPAQGKIKPKEKEWLTIPVVPEAYGQRVSEYEKAHAQDRKLVFIQSKSDPNRALLIEALAKSMVKKAKKQAKKAGMAASTVKAFRVVYVLRKGVWQPAEPLAKPASEVIAEALSRVAISYLQAKASLNPSAVASQKT